MIFVIVKTMDRYDDDNAEWTAWALCTDTEKAGRVSVVLAD
jgi:hypothetical protein